jgi:hypothetical protein
MQMIDDYSDDASTKHEEFVVEVVGMLLCS